MGKRPAFRHARTMAAIINVIVPIFAIILAGNVVARTRLFGDEPSGASSRFVCYAAGPVLALVSLHRTPVEDFFNIPFLGALRGGVVMTLSLGLLPPASFERASPSTDCTECAPCEYRLVPTLPCAEPVDIQLA